MGNIINILKKPKVSKVLKYNKVDCIVNNAITFTEQDIEFCYECEKIYIYYLLFIIVINVIDVIINIEIYIVKNVIYALTHIILMN